LNLEPVKLIPFRLHDISDFMNQEHPELHPKTPQFEIYWKEQFDYCINGKWGHDYDSLKDEGGYRWMPNTLYFYISMGVITQEGDFGTEVEKSPLLRDVEWFIFYGLAECEGFAGFSEDKERSCYRPLEKIQKGIPLTNAERIYLNKYKKYLTKPNGDYKEYVSAREMLYSTHEKPLGKPLWLNECQDFLLVSTRGVGKSFSISQGLVGHDYNTNGAKTVDEFLQGTTKSTTVVGSGDSSKSSEFLSKFKTLQEHLRTKVGAYQKGLQEEQGIFWKPSTGSLAPGTDNPFTNEVKLKGNAGTKGPGSKVVHVSYHVNPSAGVGYRARKMVIEEVGLTPRFERVHAENQGSLTRDTRFGFCAYIGTGGQVEKTKEVQDAFENPKAYNILGYDDHFGKSGTQIGAFIPSYYRKNIYKDENGNTNIEEAFNDEITARESKKKDSEIAYEGYCISYPIIPQEMFLATADNPFPIATIDDRLTELNSGLWKKKAIVARIDYTNSEKTKATYKPIDRENVQPIYKLRQENTLQGKEPVGATVIYEPPVPDASSWDSYTPLYIVAYDPVLKEDGGTSMCAVTVFKLMRPRAADGEVRFNIVAEWIGRYNDTNKNHEKAFELAALYQCKILSEDNINSIVRYSRSTNREHLLEMRPDNALSKIKVKQKRSNVYGIQILPGMIPKLEKALVDLLDVNTLQPDEREYVGEDGIIERERRMVEECLSIRFLEEMKYYKREGNSDYVSAMFMVALWVQEIEIRPVESYDDQRNKDTKVKDVLSFIHKRNRSKPIYEK